MSIPVKTYGGELPPLGSAEAAVQSCVSLIASMSNQPENVMAYWLDLYYQVRAVYEHQVAEQVERTLRHEDLLPALRALWQEVMRSPEAEAKPEPVAAGSEPEAEPAPEPKDKTAQQPAEPESADEEPKAARMTGQAAAQFKRDTLARYERLRGEGVSVHQILMACGKHPTPTELERMIRREASDFKCWRGLGEALDKVEKERAAGGAQE